MGADRRPPTPAEDKLLSFFAFAHLPPKLSIVSQPFYELAHNLVGLSKEPSAELTMALRKLLESKDCAVRAAL